MTGWRLACAPSSTMLAQEEAALEKVLLLGSDVKTSLLAQPATPVAGEAGWQGEKCSYPVPSLHGPSSTPGEGDVGRRCALVVALIVLLAGAWPCCCHPRPR
jgi:hypothetical protein